MVVSLVKKYKRCLDCDRTRLEVYFYSYINKSGTPSRRGHCRDCALIRQKRAASKYKRIHGRCRSSYNYVRKFTPVKSNCAKCNAEYIKIQKTHKYCSQVCKAHANNSTDKQYGSLSGHWPSYFRGLANQPHRKPYGLTWEDLNEVYLRQKGLCALSGVELTCLKKKGTIFRTNASVDRIQAGGPYTKDNIQLVCSALNKFRTDLSVEEFIDWCRKVVEHAEPKKVQ